MFVLCLGYSRGVIIRDYSQLGVPPVVHRAVRCWELNLFCACRPWCYLFDPKSIFFFFFFGIEHLDHTKLYLEVVSGFVFKNP